MVGSGWMACGVLVGMPVGSGWMACGVLVGVAIGGTWVGVGVGWTGVVLSKVFSSLSWKPRWSVTVSLTR